MKKFRIVIAEDHRLFREGLKAMINARDDMEVIGEAEDGLVALKMVAKLCPDLLLLDFSMPRMDGISVLTDVKRQVPGVKVLMLTIHESDLYVLEAFKTGADGYCIKDASYDELMMAITAVLSGKSYISPQISDQVIDGFLEGRKKLKTETTWETITQREREVLKLIAENYKNKDIASILGISVKTVEKHRSNLMTKLDRHSVSALTTFAIEKGIVVTKR